jgi:hypothetical protein
MIGSDGIGIAAERGAAMTTPALTGAAPAGRTQRIAEKTNLRRQLQRRGAAAVDVRSISCIVAST